MNKIILPHSFKLDDHVSRIIDVCSKGIDKTCMEKRAAMFDDRVRNIKPEAGHTLVHIITTGAGESYGCFPAGALIKTIDGDAPIETIGEGQLVLTHENRFRPVSKTFSRECSDDLVELSIQNFPHPIISTPNHPYRTVKRKDVKHLIGQCWYEKEQGERKEELIRRLSALPGEWSTAEDVQIGDYVYMPCDFAGDVEQLPAEWAYLLGLYTAEGCIAREYRKDLSTVGDPKRIIYVMHKETDARAIEKARLLVSSMGYKLWIGDSYNNVVTCRMELSFNELAKFVVEHIGISSNTKRLSNTILGQSKEWLLEFAAGYLDGDGHITHSSDKYDGAVRYSTASRQLAYDLPKLFAKVGIVVSTCLCYNRESNGCLGKGDLPIYSGSIGCIQAGVLQGHTARLDIKEKQGTSNSGYYILPNGNILARVKGVSSRGSFLSTAVFNIEVEEDNSYVVDGVAVHNSNSNADFFNKTACEVEIPHPKRGMTKTAKLDGGLLKYHSTFMTNPNAGIFKNHASNKDPKQSSGIIKLEAYNHKMERGELIVALDNNKWAAELEKMSREEPVYWSVGCVVPNDRCSGCGHVRRTRAESCGHIRDHLLEMDKNGHQIFAYNDTPKFHDISGVFRPADKIAFSLRTIQLDKAASEAAGRVVSSLDLAELERYSPPTSFTDKYVLGGRYDRLATLNKLAAMEVESERASGDCPLGLSKLAFQAGSGFEEVDPIVLQKLAGNLDGSLAEMSRANVTLPLESFLKLVMGDKFSEVESHLPSAKAALPSLFRDISSSPDLDSILGDGSYDGGRCLCKGIRDAVGGLTSSHGLDEAPVRRRITMVVIRKPKTAEAPIEKESSEAGRYLATQYGKYLLSSARGKDDCLLRNLVAAKS